MRLVTYRSERGDERLGVWLDEPDAILDAQAARIRASGSEHPAYTSMQHLIETGEPALDELRTLVTKHHDADRVERRESGQLLAPLPRPVQMRDCLCFEDHLINAIDGRNRAAGRTQRSAEQQRRLDLFRTRPFWYKCNRFAFSGPDAVVHWPQASTSMDYELELAAVIGKRGRGISEEEASAYIFGYTIFNDLSARDIQPDEMSSLGPSRSKDFDGANVLGPCITTADAFNVADAHMKARVNGQDQGGGSTSSMYWTFPQLIAFISETETLYPGELLGSGTVGTGCGLELGRKLRSGDVVELEIEGIGVLRNQVLVG